MKTSAAENGVDSEIASVRYAYNFLPQFVIRLLETLFLCTNNYLVFICISLQRLYSNLTEGESA